MGKYKPVTLFLIIVSIITFFVSYQKIFAQSVVFSDDFNDGNATGWDVIGSSGWNVQDGEYGIFLNPGLSNTVPNDSLWNYEWTNILYEVKLTGKQGVDKNILVKFKDTSNFIELHANDQGIVLEKASSIGGARILAFSGLQLSNNVNYQFKFEISENKYIKVYLNNALLFDVTETEPLITNWKIGLRAGTGGTPIVEVWFDNVVVTQIDSATPTLSPTPTPTPTPTSTPLPSLNVPDIKQYSQPWKDQIYDNATSWSSNPTIERWGCALTSASMILQYFGHNNADPATLNNWLNSQPDGYLRNGLLNWLAVSRYTKINTSNISPTLEFRRLAATTANLSNELSNGRPAILQEPGHLIVAKSQTATSFGINDPAFSEKTSLNAYGNTFSALNSYRPTNTDLSYLLLVISENFNLKVYEPDGTEIGGYLFYEEPLTDDLDGTSQSGEALTIFEYPTPTIGQYKVDVSGPEGSYTINFYTYDEDGKLTDNGPSTLTTSSFNLYLNYDSDSSTPPIEAAPVISAQSSTTPSNSTALITWTTDRIASSRVVYDTSSHANSDSPPNYGYSFSTSTFNVSPKVLNHAITLTGLSDGSIYYYRVVSAGSPTIVGEEKTFKTLSIAGPPQVSIAQNIKTSTPRAVSPGRQEIQSEKILGEETQAQPEQTLIPAGSPKTSFVKQNLGWFIILFLALSGIAYLQIARPITGKAHRR